MAGSEQSLSYCLPNGTRRHSATNEHHNNMLFLEVFLLALSLWSGVEAGKINFKNQKYHGSEGKEIVKYKTKSHDRYEFGMPGKSVRGSYSFIGDDGRTYSINYIADDKGFRAYGAHLPWSNLLDETANILQAEPFNSENSISAGDTTESNDAAQMFSLSNGYDDGEKLEENNVPLPTRQSELADIPTLPTDEKIEGNELSSSAIPIPGDGASIVNSTQEIDNYITPEATTVQSEITTTIPPIKQFFVADVPAVTRVITSHKLVKGPKKIKKTFPKAPSKIIRFKLSYNPTYQSHTLTRILE